MNISSTGGVEGAQPVRPIREARPIDPTQSVEPVAHSDQAEISQEARLLQKLSQLPEIREDKITELRRLIASGEFDTEERLRGAVDRLIDESL